MTKEPSFSLSSLLDKEKLNVMEWISSIDIVTSELF
jgi:hypothetical protein